MCKHTTRLIALILSCFALSSCSSFKNPPPSGLEGRVVINDRLLSGARIHAFRSINDIFNGSPVAHSDSTAIDGTYTFPLAPGRYFLVASKPVFGQKPTYPPQTGDYFAYHGSNPVEILPAQFTFVGFNGINTPPKKRVISTSDTKHSLLSGRVTYLGNPVPGAWVYLYLDNSSYFRGPGYQAIGPTGPDGRFQAGELPETSYYLVARKRKDASKAGPIGIGDYYGYFPFNPIEIEYETKTEVTMELITKAGEINKARNLNETRTILTGTIVDTAGRPQADTYAFVYSHPEMSHKKPLFLSQKTKADGKFTIYLESGGHYYLGARNHYGSSPKPGEYYGKYDQTPDHSIELKTNQRINQIIITVQKIPQT